MGHLYSVGYGSYEDSGAVLIEHEAKFSNAEFESMIAQVAPDAYRAAYAREEEQKKEFKARYEEAGLPVEPDRVFLTFANIYRDVAVLLCERFGFREAVMNAEFCAFGWAALDVRDDWKSERAPEVERLTKALEADGIAVLSGEEAQKVDDGIRERERANRAVRRAKRAEAAVDDTSAAKGSEVEK